MHKNKNKNKTVTNEKFIVKDEDDVEKTTEIELNEKSEIKTYKFSRTLTIGGLVVSVILLIIILVLVYMHFYK